MKKLLLILMVVSNLSYAGFTETHCFHNGDAYKVIIQQGNLPAATCPDYSHSDASGKVDKVNASQSAFIKTISDPDHCTFKKNKSYEDLGI